MNRGVVHYKDNASLTFFSIAIRFSEFPIKRNFVKGGIPTQFKAIDKIGHESEVVHMLH